MIVLACETSTLLGSAAIVEDGRILAVAESLRQGSHSDMLNIYIEQALEKAGRKLADVDLFVTGVGPGSFTGIRISLNAIKTLAYCHNKNVAAGNSLMSLAAATQNSNSFSEFCKIPIVSMINAYKNMCYVSLYEWVGNDLVERAAPQVVRVQNLNDFITAESVVCGDGYTTYQKYFSPELSAKLRRVPDISDHPHAATLALLACSSKLSPIPWNQLLPLYLRASEAEENLLGIKYQPLI